MERERERERKGERRRKRMIEKEGDGNPALGKQWASNHPTGSEDQAKEQIM